MSTVIKGVGKKIIINNDNLFIKKTIGKDIEIPISNIKTITYDKGTMKRNGTIFIEYDENKKENIFFYCYYNDIVQEFINAIDKKINNPDEVLEIEEKEKIGIFKQIITESKEQLEIKTENKQKEKEKLQKLQKDGVPYCPKCYSTSLTTTNKKLSVGRAAVGGALLGGAGAILGGLTSKKVELLCMNCGHKFKPGKK